MNRQILLGILPYLILIGGSVALLRCLLWFSDVRLDLKRLRQLPSDQVGSVQSLSFVMTIPLFVIVMMFIVQLSQLTIAKVFVEYAAFNAARTAIVWIPAHFGPGIEPENCIGGPRNFADSEPMFSVYRIEEPSPKFNKIHFSAVMALLPICPSRNTGADPNHPMMVSVPSLTRAISALAPSTNQNTRIPTRIANKLAYALENTRLTLELRHRLDEPALREYTCPCQYPHDEYAPNEYGWLDQITVKLSHEFALLPGPGRILARRADAPIGSDPQQSPGSDSVARLLNQHNGVYRYTLTATARLGNEGKKSVLRYVQPTNGNRPTTTTSFAFGQTNSPSGEAPAEHVTRVLEFGESFRCLECRQEAKP